MAPDTNRTTDEEARLVRLLRPAEATRLRQLHDAPKGAIGVLRDDPALAAAIARADVVPRLQSWFTPRADLPGRDADGWAHEPERSGPVGDASVCVTWSFAGTYQSTDGSFNGLTALGQQVSLHGVTFMGVEHRGGASDAAAEFLLRRYIDWAGLYAQLGLTLNWRIPHEADSSPRQPA